MRRPWVGGNWKMMGRRASVEALLAALRPLQQQTDVDVALMPPAPFWGLCRDWASEGAVQIVAQHISARPDGAWTGELSIGMLQDWGLSGALVGHSERRQSLGQTDEEVADTCAALLAAGVQPVLCVGETQAQREADQTLSVIQRQLDAVLARVGIEALASFVIAYEPVWAIGTGLTATPAQAQAVHAAIRAHVAHQNASVARAVRVVYGGSVKAENAAGLMAMPDIDGALVGGASWQAADFTTICHAAAARRG